MKLLLTLIFIITAFSFRLAAQPELTLNEAIKIALENNYNIRLIANNAAVSKNNVSRANAGMLPAVTGNLLTSNTLQNGTQTQSNGDIVTRNGAKNTNLSYGTTLNWTVFDGFKMFATYDRLKELQKLSETEQRLTMLTTLSDVINTYYNIVSQQQQIKATEAAVALSRLRVTNSRNRYEIGRASKLELLNSTVDLNADTANLLIQRNNLANTKSQLNEILASDIKTDYSISDTIIIDSTLTLEALNFKAMKSPVLVSAIINKRIASLALDEVKAERYPKIGVFTGYNFNKRTSALEYAQASNSRGLNYGLTASVNIFNGFLQKKNERNALIETQNADLRFEQTNLNITTSIYKNYRTYATNIELAKLESLNVSIAKQNLDITMEKYRIGSIAPLEFREAQRNYIDASYRFTNALFQAKLSETALKEISGYFSLSDN